MPSDLPMTAEEIAALREERDRLQTERDSERQRADAEARRAETLHGQVLTSSRQIAASTVASLAAQEQQAEATIGGLTQNIAALRAQRQSMLEEGKFSEEGEINEKIAEAIAQRQHLQQAKTYIAQQRQTASDTPVDPVDRFFQQNPQFSEAERTWIRRNPRYATDSEFMQRVNAAHAKAIDNGIPRQSEDYFKTLEDAGYMRQSAPQVPSTPRRPAATLDDADPNGEGEGDEPFSVAAAELLEEPPVQQPQRPAAPRAAAAPPSRRSPTAPAPRRVVGQLTPEQADTALRNADLAPREIQEQGDAAILNWWSELNNSTTARRLREEWAAT